MTTAPDPALALAPALAPPAPADSPESLAPFTNYTADHRLAIAQLIATQQQLGMNDTEFCAGADLDATTWSRLRKGIYITRQGPGKQIVALKRHSKNLCVRKQMNDNRASLGLDTRDFIRFADYDAVLAAVNSAIATAERGGENKLVIYVAPSGGGKTRAALQLTREGFKARMVTARPSWSRSYFPALLAIARCLDMGDDYRVAHHVERDVLKAMEPRSERGVLIINEFEMVCKPMQDFLRSILNETSWAILILITPEGYRKLLRRGGGGIEQLMRRCEAVIESSEVTGPQVQAFFEQHWPLTPELKTAALEVAQEAQRFGGFDCICCVIDYLVTEFGEVPPTLQQVRDKTRVYRESKPLTATAERRASL